MKNHIKQQQSVIACLKSEIKKHRLLYSPLHFLFTALRWLIYFPKWQFYKLFAKFNGNGINKTECRSRKIIVSLTSYPARIEIVPYVIVSLLNQTMKPDKIILWLGSDKFPDKKLPEIFERLKDCGLDVEFRKDLGPHTKYFYAMKEYPEDIIITFDDDIIYDDYIVETLYNSYVKHPECVSAMHMVKITFLPDGNIADYLNFDFSYPAPVGLETHAYLSEGVRGILYPPHCMHNEVFNIEAMQRLCPKVDDIWLKIMELLNGTKSVSAYGNLSMPGWYIPSSQNSGLWLNNQMNGGNDRQMKAAIDVYNTWPLAETGKTLLEMMREDSDGVE